MSTPIEFEPPARQDFGPTTSTSDFEPLLVHKLADSMSIPSVDVPQAMPNDVQSEPDSTEPTILHVYRADVGHNFCDSKNEYLITETDVGRAVDSVPDETAPRTYTLLERDDSDEGGYTTATASTVGHVANSVQSITKLPQSYTLNVDASVSSIATIQSAPCVTSSNQMLLLPTILATGAQTLDKPLEGAGSPTGISQIIITSDAYTNSFSQPNQRTNILPETNYITRPKSAKVQILSNISLPKTTNVVTYSQQYVSSDTPLYNASEQVYKLNTGVANIHSKHPHHSVGKPAKNPVSVNYPNMTSTVISQAHIKSVGYAHTFPKGSITNKTINKVNNGANLSAGSVGPPGSNQCHILSRVVSGPKLAVQPGRKGLNTFTKGVKNSSQNTQCGPKNQSRSIKIIQQTGTSKPEMKSWSVANVNSKVNAAYSVEGSIKTAQKKASPTHKSSHPLLTPKSLKNEQRVVLQSPCGPVLISTAPISVSHHRPSHYVQSGSPSLRYVHNYVPQPADNILSSLPVTSQMSANQHLTAQILQSLSQPKLMLQSTAPVQLEPFVPPPKPVQHRRHISGDPSTLLIADDIIGMEERPNLSEEIIRYTHDSLAFVMLDHTYALSAQKLSPVPVSSPTVISTAPPITSPEPAVTLSPVRGLSSPPAVTSTVHLNDFQTVTASTGALVPSSPVANVPTLSNFSYKTTALPPRPEDDDAGSAISSTDGLQLDHAGSDTETAPEVDEGKTRCICDFTHDDGYMICCDRCGEWQHVDCMGIDRNNIPDAYLCSECQPRKVERRVARAMQMRKREEFGYHGSGSESDGTHSAGLRRKRLLTVTTYSDTSGACITTYNNVPVPPPQPPAPQPKRIPIRRPKKTDIIRKGTKRKLTEKRVKRKKDMVMNRSKYMSMNSQSSWHDAYEQAVTNHYSPELRAKIIRYGSKVGNSPNMAQAISAHYCTTVPHAGGKILIATRDLQENTPIVELRGKYMLSTQHRPQIQMSSRAGGQKPGPFVFFYRLPKDNTQVCIDTRTYGNEARFVRRSCKYNAELQHCIVKGTLHVYIVSLGAILDGTEITVPHDHSGGKQPCACGNPKHCKLNGFNTVAARKAPVDYPLREKRSRHRRSSSSSPGSPQESPPVAPVQRRLSVISANVKSPIKLELTSPLKTWGTTFTDALISDSIFKEEKPEEVEISKIEPIKSEDAVDSAMEIVKLETKEELVEPEEAEPVQAVEIKSEILELKIETKEPLLSPVKELKQEVTKEEVLPPIEVDKIPLPEGPPPKAKEEEKVTRSVTARAVCHERSTRSTRTSIAATHNQDSVDEKTDDSQDKLTAKDKRKMTREERKMEAIMRAFERMEKAEQRKQEVRERQSKRRESDPTPPTDKDADDDDNSHTTPAAKKRRQRKGRARTTSQNASRRRLNSADSDMVTSGDEAHTSPCDEPTTPVVMQPPIMPTQDVGLSSACLLVEAAVGPLESAFKLPKTKKTMANEWVGRSPEHNASYISSYRSPPMSARSLESLVRVASTMIGDLGGNTSEPEDGSPPRTPTRGTNRPPKKMKRGANKAVVPEPAVVPVTQHSAKKRWLRQAISEESDSPTAESPPNEMVTPLKKRRLARESLSLEQPVINNKPEDTSPPITSEDSPVKEDGRDSITRHCKMKSRYIDSMYGSEYSSTDHSMDAQNVFLNMSHPCDEKFNLDIRRIIGVPGTEETYDDIPMPKTPEDRHKPIDVNDNEFQQSSLPDEEKASKETPMEIDTEISPPRAGDVDDTAENKPNDSQTESRISIHSNDTSGNSSPQRDEMDDIQKKIHSFHTENIQILKIRNKKPPKEKRKKVNLNFDLNMVDDQISIQLRTDGSPKPGAMNGEVDTHSEEPIMIAADSIPLPPPVGSVPLSDSDPRYIPWTEDIPLPAEPMKPKTPEPMIVPVLVPEPVSVPVIVPEQTKLSPVASSPSPVLPMSSPVAPVTVSPPVSPEKAVYVNKTVAPEDVQISASVSATVISTEENLSAAFSAAKIPPVENVQLSTFCSPAKSPEQNVQMSKTVRSAGLFSGFFKNMMVLDEEPLVPVIRENISHLNIIDTINKNMEGGVFSDKPSVTPVDELRNVQEILDRVNSMDANTSMILSGVLNSDVASKTEPLTPVTTFCPRSNDPRLNPPPADKPKPVRRKLSITEYLKRHKTVSTGGADATDQISGVATGGAVDHEFPRPCEWSSDSSTAASRSPLRLDVAASVATEELETRLNQALKTPLLSPFTSRGITGSATGEFDAQPTQLERQRENLSQRLRRDFGLTLPEDEEARSATALQGAEPSQPVEQHITDLMSDKFPRPVAHNKLPHDR